MAVVTVHDSVKVGEGDNLEDGGVDLTIGRELVRVHSDLMELKHVIGLERTGRRWARLAVSWTPFGELCRVEVLQLVSDFRRLLRWNPHVADKGLLVELELVHGVVDGLLLGDEPFVDLEHAHVFIVVVSLG